MAERRVFSIGPQAETRRGGDHHPAGRRQHPPDLAHQGQRVGAFLQPVDHQDPVEQGVGQGELGLVHQAGPVAVALRPAFHALSGRHGGDHAAGQPKTVKERRCVAEPQNVEASHVAPALLDLAADHLARGAAERRGVEPA